jgi:hypothetical protein
MIELYVEISSIDNAGNSLNNLPKLNNRTENIIPSIINLAHQIHETDPQRLVYPTLVGLNVTDEWEQNDCDEGDDVRNEDNHTHIGVTLMTLIGGTMRLFTTVKYYLIVISKILNTLSTLKKA